MAATKDVAYFCPECGAASVDYSNLVGGKAACRACKWTGESSKLVGYVFSHEHGDSTEAIRNLMNDLRRLYSASMAVPLGQLLLKWGFLDTIAAAGGVRTLSSQQLARYLSAIAQATLRAIIETRDKMEKERVDGI